MSVAIVLNNYFHDLATGVFAACAIALWGLARSARGDAQKADALGPTYHALTIALWISVAWIVLGGVPRTVFFPRYEFIPAVGKHIVPALVVKHVLMFTSVGIGVFAWVAARRAIGKRP